MKRKHIFTHAALLLASLPILHAADAPTSTSTDKIDRHALVTRHNVVLTTPDRQGALQVGNGEFAFGVDLTGLQTFYGNTFSHWGWHTAALPPGERIEDFRWTEWKHAGHNVPYMTASATQKELTRWLYLNPSRLALGRLAMRLTKADGQEANQQDLQDVHQELDLWRGLITSRFTFEGQSVKVETSGDPRRDAVAVRIESPLVASGRLGVSLDFPGADVQNALPDGDWSRPEAHRTVMTPHGSQRADFTRTLDATRYFVALEWSPGGVLQNPSGEPPLKALRIIKAEYGAKDKWVDATTQVAAAVHGNRLSVIASSKIAGDPIKRERKSLKVTYALDGEEKSVDIRDGETLGIQATSRQHRYELSAKGADHLDLVCAFSPTKSEAALPTPETVSSESAKYWESFWHSGGAIDLSGSKDPRWRELERRIVLSQYLMAVNEAGSVPPQESGLYTSGWSGKFHLEMYWWHGAQFALWDRWPLWDRSLGFFKTILPQARATAQKQGYKGARWPKMIGPEARESTNNIGPLLIWQQPHPIFYAELDYRAHPTKETLEKWREVVFETAEFMADFPVWNDARRQFDLAPPIRTVPENTNPNNVLNPAFETAYWRFGLRTAQLWRERLGMAREANWDKVLKALAPLPQRDGLYLLEENLPDTYTKYNWDHPSMLGALGVLPGDGVDAATMRRTVDKVRQVWNWNNTWGWDFPLTAMCAAKCGDPQAAVDMLMHPSASFQFNASGLPIRGRAPYLPSSGGLLYAVALMAAGWDGAPDRNAPGFPDDGSWSVKWEGLKKAP